MPFLIGEVHNKILDKFNTRNESKIFNKRIVEMIVDSDRCIIPAELMITMHFSQIYNYCFYATVKPLYHISPFKNALKYESTQIYMLSFNPKTGRVMEFSENLLELARINSPKLLIAQLRDLIVEDKKITIGEMFIDFDFNQYKH